MAISLDPPSAGTLKIDVHATYSATPMENGNVSGIGAIYRNHNGVLKHTTVGIIPHPTPLWNQLRAVYVALKRAKIDGYHDVILEMDNINAFRGYKRLRF